MGVGVHNLFCHLSVWEGRGVKFFSGETERSYNFW